MTDLDVDGRRLRREQNRVAVLDALVALFAEGTYEPGAAVIADRAGISARSVFRYFDDGDDLNRAAIERHLQAAAPLLDPGVTADTPIAPRIEGFVAARVRLHEAIAPAARAARVCAHRVPVVAEQIRKTRSFLRRQVKELFAPDEELLAAVDALCAFETYDLLRARGMSRPQIEAALVAALTALVGR